MLCECVYIYIYMCVHVRPILHIRLYREREPRDGSEPNGRRNTSYGRLDATKASDSTDMPANIRTDPPDSARGAAPSCERSTKTIFV